MPLLFAVLLSSGPGLGVVAADDLATNVLDRPMADAIVLPTIDPTATPDLLVLLAPDPQTATARLAVLRHGTTWQDIATSDIDLGAGDTTDRWLVPLDYDRYALIATARPDAAANSAVVVMLTVAADGAGWDIAEHGRQTFDRAIELSGAADVDGFGSPELVLGMRTVYDGNDSCGSTSLIVLDAAHGAMRRAIDLPGRLGSGVLGPFDATSGDDLVTYISEGCAPGVSRTGLLRVDLADGLRTPLLEPNVPGDPADYPPPLRLDLDPRRPSEVLAAAGDGVWVLDPQARTPAQVLVARAGSVPLIADRGVVGRADAFAARRFGSRVAVFDPNELGRLVVGDVWLDVANVQWEERTGLLSSEVDPTRWAVIQRGILSDAIAGRPAVAWSGAVPSSDCPALVVPGAVMPCGDDTLRAGSAWLATRPFGDVPTDGGPGALIAAGLGWDHLDGLPADPTPAAAGPVGWWRRGPSAPFALSMVSYQDLGFVHALRTPTTTIAPTLDKDGTTALPGQPGARFFARITPLAASDAAPSAPATILDSLTGQRSTDERGLVGRVPLGDGSGVGSGAVSSARLDLGPVGAGGTTQVDRWSIQVVSVDGWGDWGAPVSGVIARDTVGPAVTVDDPFLSPVWPIAARLSGRTEPGSTVSVDGQGTLDVDRDGGFTIEQALAPWPQTIRVTATDAGGNPTVATFSVIGGIDYRRIPWPGVGAAALFSVLAVRGLLGDRRRRDPRVIAPVRLTDAFDEGDGPEIEELPSGGVVRD